MMGKLIDTDVLKQELYQQWFMDILLTQKSGKDMFYALAQRIDTIPVAYDPDKVVAELERKKFIEQETILSDIHQGFNAGLSAAIHVVKGGGVDG